MKKTKTLYLCGSYLFQIWLSKSNTEKTHFESQLYSATQLFGQIGFHTLSTNPVACSDRISRRLLRLFLLTLSFFNRPSFDAFLPAVWPSHHIHHEMAPLPIRVGPSVLAGDLSMLAKDARRVLRAGADFIHLDVFDGNWIKGAFTFGPMVSGMRFFPDVPIFLIRKHLLNCKSPHPKWWFRKGNPLISGKPRLVKYYNLARKCGFGFFQTFYIYIPVI